MRRIVVPTSLVLLFLLAFTPIASAEYAPAASAPTVYASPSQVKPGAAGSSLTVEVRIDKASDLVAWELRISVDPNVVRIKSFAEGEFLKRNGGSTITVGANVAADGGSVTFAVARTGTDQGVTGSGVLGNLVLTSVKAGTSNVNLSNVELLNSKQVQTAITSAENKPSTPNGPPAQNTPHTQNEPSDYVPSPAPSPSESDGQSADDRLSQPPMPSVPTSQAPVAAAPSLGEIRGRVVNQAKRVVRGTTARIDGIKVKVGSKGIFAFTLVHPGTYTIHYNAPGYVGQTQKIEVVGGTVTAAPTVILKQNKRSHNKIGKRVKKVSNRGKKSKGLWLKWWETR